MKKPHSQKTNKHRNNHEKKWNQQKTSCKNEIDWVKSSKRINKRQNKIDQRLETEKEKIETPEEQMNHRYKRHTQKLIKGRLTSKQENTLKFDIWNGERRLITFKYHKDCKTKLMTLLYEKKINPSAIIRNITIYCNNENVISKAWLRW